jgi:hypothetical protein
MADVSPVATTSLTVVAPKPAAAHHMSFREFLSELNPLQYIPVIGTLYRAITGDTIPEAAREIGSLVVSGLTGGPVGIAINLGTLAAEKITGIDPEKIGDTVLADIGIGTPAKAKPAPAAQPNTPSAPPVASAAPNAPAAPWSPAQLTAYGVTVTPEGTLHHGALTGSDVLNDLELARHRPVLVT